ncbi:MAG: hypothetical protein AVDCRST_MAG23-1178 [uncultured Sphingosinicella sp.]|uniref:Ferric uptake regulation protein n=1 Tax=uncultured Sphingosinicella sp. TaxID=478748 RepID=A0A6J4TWC3_9SPHN|nr:hypothetical protein [uncultured Sphingosinicella sp.]CAA9532726.1 MAG: hypothetical protein AVDCRST_MAG23-1178 [uncultured Sphingosinicella sp.]
MGALGQTTRAPDTYQPNTCSDGAVLPLEAYHEAGTARQVPWSALLRHVLALLWKSRLPWGAYAITEALGRSGTKCHPNSIYRSLKTLQSARLVIPIVSWSRYIISPDPGIHSWGVILCSRCRNYAVVPLEDDGRLLWSVARGLSFRPEQSAIECHGKCTSCAAQEAG